MAASISDVELREFHSMERSLYVKLVSEVRILPDIAKLIMTFWLWLESVGHPDVIQIITSHDNRVIELLAQEAEQCLKYLRPDVVPPTVKNDIPITAGLLGQPVCLRHFHDYRRLAINGISRIFNDVGSRIFADLELACPIGHVGGASDWNTIFEGTSAEEGGSSGVPLVEASGVLLPIMRTWTLGSEAALHLGRRQGQNVARSETRQSELRPPVVPIPTPIRSTLNPLAQPWVPQQASSSTGEIWDDRTMFLTFSRGHPLREEEIREYFTGRFGDVVRVVAVQRTAPGMWPLYARIAFRTPDIIPQVLNGEDKAKLVIHGKDIWARIYQTRRV